MTSPYERAKGVVCEGGVVEVAPGRDSDAGGGVGVAGLWLSRISIEKLSEGP